MTNVEVFTERSLEDLKWQISRWLRHMPENTQITASAAIYQDQGDHHNDPVERYICIVFFIRPAEG